jgi:hypothetical protein
MRRRSARSLSLALGAVGVSVVALAAGGDAARDRDALDRVRDGLGSTRAAIREMDIEAATHALRGAIVSAAGPLEGPWHRHAWTRLARKQECEAAREGLARCAAELERATAERAANVRRVEDLLGRAAAATSLDGLMALETERAAAEAALRRDAAAAHASLVDLLRRRRAALQAARAREIELARQAEIRGGP